MSSIYERSSHDADMGYEYSRYKNPTRDVLDTCLAAMDNAKYALTFSAGVGAISGILTTLNSGDHVISTKDLYGGTLRLFRDLAAAKMNIEFEFVDFNDLKTLEKSFKPNTKMVWVESPTNPLMTIVDIKAIADIVHAKSKAFFVVDNTFLTSYLQRPLELGADVVMYSMSKFANGHSDIVMGSVVTNNEKFYETLKYFQVSTGLVPSPFDCYMVNRSMKTLALRMERHSQNSYQVAKFLDAHEKVEKVFHPSLKTHPKHEIALAQSYGHSGVLSFYIKGSIENAEKFFKSLKVVLFTLSLGGVESTTSLPWSMSHGDMSEADRIAVGVTKNLIRLSVGIEDVSEIIADLDQALNQA